MINLMKQALSDIRQHKPLILNLTNYVTMDFVANTLLALGAAPIMTVCLNELEELVAMSSAITVNIGTLDVPFVEKCTIITQLAQQYQKPVVLDPVGAGASQIRTMAAKQIMQRASIIRGNASEIMALAGISEQTKGVESINGTEEAKQTAIALARKLNCTIVVSGAIDFITDGQKQVDVTYGSPMMSLVTGMGCAMTSVLAAFRAVRSDGFEASLIGTHYFTRCGSLAALKAHQPGAFRSHFIDELYAANFKTMSEIQLGKSHYKSI